MTHGALLDLRAQPETMLSVCARGSSDSLQRLVPPPSALGRYQLLGLRGLGGMGVVYEARDPELDRNVAIKVLRDRSGDTDLLRREAQVLARLVHPNVVTIHDVGVSDGQVFIVIQLVTGESIDRWAEHASADQILSAFRHAGRGLAAAHAAGIVHCDFKPANVLIDHDGTVRVGDFGIARVADDASAVAGTPAYMAPEQFTGVATPASDQYAFCAALWEVLAGERLFPTSSLDEPDLDDRRYRALPRRARVSARVERAIARGLAADPEQRFASMADLLTALVPPRRRWRTVGAVGMFAMIASAAFGLRRDSGLVEAAAVAPSIPARRPDPREIRALTQLGADSCAYAPAISGDRVVFDRTTVGAVDLYELPLAGGAPRRLTSAAPWEWRAQPGRRDGEVLHLTHDPDRRQGASISFLDLASSAVTPVLDVYATDAVAIGDTVFYIPNNQREVRRFRSGRDEVFAVAPDDDAFVTLAASPTGDRIATQGRDRLCTIDTASGALACNAIRAKSRPAFGERGLYFAAKDGLHRLDLQTRKDELVLADVYAPGGLAISRDGSTLVFSACGSLTRLVQYGDSPRAVVDGPSVRYPVTSRHGDLAWVRFKRGAHVLMLRTADGSERQLTHPDFGDVRSPAFSPDGEALTFAVAGAHPGIYVIARAGGSDTVGLFAESNLQQLTDDPSDERPTWTTEGTIAFTRTEGRAPGVHTIAGDGGPSRKLATGRRVIGSRGAEVLIHSERAMYWIDTRTGAERPGPVVTRSSTFTALSPSGTWIAFARGGGVGQTLWRQRSTPGARLERIAELPTGHTMKEIAITDDGDILGTPTTWSGELFTVPAPEGGRF